MNNYLKWLLTATALTYCAVALSEEQSVVEQCAANLEFVKINDIQVEDHRVITLQTPVPLDEDTLREFVLSPGGIPFCMREPLYKSEYSRLLSELSPGDKELLAQYVATASPTSELNFRQHGILAQTEKTARERANILFSEKYSLDFISDLIIDRSNSTHYKLIYTVDKGITRDEICSNLKKDSTDYKWCMGETTHTPKSGCKNSYGDACGTRY